MRLLVVATLLAAIFGLTIEFGEESKTAVTVGALFFGGETDIEMSFDAALREFNSSKLFELSFTAIKRYVPMDDSIWLQRMTCELIANGVAAIFGPSSKASSDIVALIANANGIPHLEYDWRIETQLQLESNHRMTVNLAPPLPLVAQAYLDIIKNNFGWKSFMVIYETDEGLARIQDLIGIQTLDSDFIKLRRLQDYAADYRVLWKEAKETYHEQRIILDCEPSSLEKLIQASIQFGLIGSFRNWFFTHLNTHSSNLKTIYNESFKANMTAVRLKLVDQNPYERKKSRPTKIDEILGNQTMLPILMRDAVILFANSARNIITQLKQYNHPDKTCEMSYSGTNRWLLGTYILKEMKTISEDVVEPPFKTENMKFNEFGQRIEFNLEIYKPTVNEPLAIWKPDSGVSPIRSRQDTEGVPSSQDFSQTRKVFTVVTRLEEPYFMYRKDAENLRGLEKFEGYAVDLIHKLSELLNFEYEFMIESGNGKYNEETKEWDGIIRRLIDHQAQIGICDLTITQSRRQVVDFTVPFMQLGISILYYKKPPEQKNPFAFLQPFAKEVWMYMLVAQLVMTLSFVFMARVSNHEWMSPNPCDADPAELENQWNTHNSFWLMIGSIMQQGCDILPRAPPMRILTGVWWFFALMMLSIYTANLAAFLTSNKLQSTINSLNDLIDQNKVKFGTVNGGSTSLFFSESNETAYMKAWNQMKTFQPSVFTKNNKEGVERVRKEKDKYAFLMETTSMSYNIERHCDLKQIGSQIGEKHYGLAVPLGAEYRTNLSVSLLQLSEKGELYRMKNKWWKTNKTVCEVFKEVDGDELSIIELGGVFLVLLGGVVLSIIIGVIEFLYNVQCVAADQGVTPCEAFKAELLFALKFWVNRKPANISSSTTNSSNTRSSLSESRKSSGQSHVQSRISRVSRQSAKDFKKSN